LNEHRIDTIDIKKHHPGYIIAERRVSYLFLVPAILFLLITSVYPLIYSLRFSLYQWNMLVPGSIPKFIGLKNYTELIKDLRFLISLKKSVIYVAGAVSLEFILGLIGALIITTSIKGLSVFRTAILIPLMMTPVVAGVLWRFLLNPEYGVINYFIGLFGVKNITWLAKPKTAFIAILIVEIWQQLPVVIFVLAAGISSLPVDIYEAAQVDGATGWQKFRYITLPLLKPVIAVVLLLRIMDAFKVFDTIYTLTYGGPGQSTELMSIYIYKQGLKYFQIGRATAMSWVFLVLVTSISIFFMRQVWKEKA